MKALVGAFNQEKALVGAFSVIVKTNCETGWIVYTTIPSSPPRRQKSVGRLWLESNLSILRVSAQLLVITSVRTAAVRRSVHYQYS